MPPPNVASMTPQQQADYINRPEHWQFRAVVQDTKLANDIMGTPYGMATINAIADGVLSGQPALTLERDEGLRPTPEFEKLLNDEYKPFLREALTALVAYGFVAIKTHPDHLTKFKTPLVPPMEDSEYHVIQNKITGKTVLKRFDVNNIKYDESVQFVIEAMPTVQGKLTSRASALFADYALLMTKYATSRVLDRRAATSELWVRKRIVDDNTETLVQGARRSVFDVQQGVEPIRTTTAQREIEDLQKIEEDQPSGVQSFVVPAANGPVVVNQLATDTEFINPAASQKRSEDLSKTQEMFKTSLTSVMNIPPALFQKDAAVHGKGLEEVDERTNEVIEYWAQKIGNIAQTVYDMSYAMDDENELRNELENFYKMKQVNTRMNQLQLLLQIQQEMAMTREVTERVFATTSQQLIDSYFVSDAEYAKMVYKRRVRIVISYNLRVSVERIYHLMEQGTVDEETGHSMVLRSLRLDNDVLGISRNKRVGVRNQKFGTSNSTRQRSANAQSQGRADKKRESRRRASDTMSSADRR